MANTNDTLGILQTVQTLIAQRYTPVQMEKLLGVAVGAILYRALLTQVAKL